MYASTDGGASAPAKASLIEDCIDIWFSPSAVFARRASGAGALGPFLVCSVLLTALYFAAMGPLQPVFDAEVARAVAQAQADNPSLTADQVAGMQGMIEGSIKYTGLVIMPVVLVLLGAGVWLMAKMFGGSLSFGGGVMVASFAYFPKTLEMLLITVQSFVRDTSAWSGRFQYSWGLGRFMDSSGPQGWYNVLGRVDLFTLWVTLLVALGLIHVAKVEKSKAFAGAAVLWALGAVPALLQVASGK